MGRVPGLRLAGVAAAGAVVVACCGLAPAASAAAAYAFHGASDLAPAGHWGKAEEVPGTAVLNAGGQAGAESVSCGSAGNCSAGGYYTDSNGRQQAFIVSEVNGTWGKAVAVPGTAALNTGGRARIESVSCGSAGECSAVGDFRNTAGRQAFVVNEQVPRRQPDLNISLRPRRVFRHGRSATFRVRIHNAGNAIAKRERVVAHLPPGMTRPRVHRRGWHCRRRRHTAVCVHRGHLRPRHSATFYLHVHITARRGRRLTTTARVTPAGSDTNNTATSTVRIR